MNYFEIYSQGFQQALDVNDDQEFINVSNTREIKPFFQGFTNFLFKQWVSNKLLTGKDIYDKNFQILDRTDFPDISDDFFKELNDFVLKRDFLYISNFETDIDFIDPYYHLFNFKGIIASLNNLENDPYVFYINKFHIANIIETYLLGKYSDFHLRVNAPSKKKRKFESTKTHLYEGILTKALIYKSKKIDLPSDSFKKVEAILEENEYYENKKEFMSILVSALKENAKYEFKREVLYKSFYDFRNFRVEVLNEICKYIITIQELEDNKKLFKMTHRKRLLLYDLLRNIEPEKRLPSDLDAYSKITTSDKDRAVREKNLIYSGTNRFDDFKRNEVIKHFG